MATRGRPTLFQTTTHLKTLRETYSADTTDRTNANRFYQQVAVDTLIEPNRDSIPGADRLEKARGCLEQLGRMIDSGTMDTGDILIQAQIAAKALEDGRTVKQVEKYLRDGRRGSFDTASIEAATNKQPTTHKKDPEECEDCFVGRYTKEVPSDALSMLEAIMLINILDNVDNALHRKPLDLLEGETKADMIQTANALRTKLAHIYLDNPPWEKVLQ